MPDRSAVLPGTRVVALSEVIDGAQAGLGVPPANPTTTLMVCLAVDVVAFAALVLVLKLLVVAAVVA